jgi:predicted transcriptional regulator
MSTAKDQITELVQKLPDDSSYEQIIRELAFDAMVQRGLKDSDEGRTVTNEEMQRRIKTWQK